MSSARCDGPMDMTERDPALEPFDVLIGTWATEATHPLIDAVVPGTVTFEWLEGGHFLVQRSHNDHELFPDAITVIGAPETGDGLLIAAVAVKEGREAWRGEGCCVSAPPGLDPAPDTCHDRCCA